MKVIPSAATKFAAKSAFKLRKHAPHIFFGAGIAGAVGGTVLACRATLKLESVLDEAKDDISSVKELVKTSRENGTEYAQEEYSRDLIYVYTKTAISITKLYGPSVVVGVASIAALTGSHVQLTRRNTALTLTLGALHKAFDEYRDRVREEFGEEKELDIYRDSREVEVEVEGKKQVEKVTNPSRFSPYARLFAEHNQNWQKDPDLNKIFLKVSNEYVNYKLNERGHVFLNDVYDSLGMERSRAGSVVGWLKDGDGDGYIDYGMHEEYNIDFENGHELNIWLDFNVDGVIYDKI